MKKSILFAAFAFILSGTAVQAQETENNWFIQTQAGVSYTSGDNNFGGLISPAAQISVGKYFSPAFGARLAISGWKGKGGNGDNRPGYDFFYGAGTVDGLLNLSNLFAGNNPDRVFNASLIAGIGYNKSEHASSFMGRAGLQGSIRLSKAFDFNIEALANGVSDRWNKKEDHSIDTYFNVLLGITYKFGTGMNLACPDCEPVYYENDCYDEEYVQSLNDKINELRKQIDEHKCPEPEPCPEVTETQYGIRSHVVFDLAKTNIKPDQEMNVIAVAEYLKNNPEAKANITGYADKGTGSAQVNQRLAKERAEAVANQLINKYGISADRLVVDSKGSEVQPFATNDWNRVVIMLAE